MPYDEYMAAVKEIGRLQEEKARLEKALEDAKVEKKPASKKAGE